MMDGALAGGDCMRSAKAGVVSVLCGALWLLSACTVPSEPPIAGSRQLASLTGLETIELCDWAREYMGGYDYRHPESDEREYTAVHYCPPTELDLGLPEDNPRRYTRWSDEICAAHVESLGGYSAIVNDFAQLVYEVSDRPCLDFALLLSTGAYYFVVYVEEEQN
jgi:hypothetical protein